MEIEKTNHMNALFEFYVSLLTDKQQIYMQLYYADDYSLGEIAEEFNVSRQAIYDNIRRTEQILLEYEKKLHLFADFLQLEKTIDKLAVYAADHYPKDERLKSLIQELKNENDETDKGKVKP